MQTYFEITTAGIPHPTEKNAEGYALRLQGYCIKFLCAMTSDSYYDELYHYALFETKEQAEALMAKIDAANAGVKSHEFPRIDLKYWITGGCVAASALKGGAFEHVWIPEVKF